MASNHSKLPIEKRRTIFEMLNDRGQALKVLEVAKEQEKLKNK